MPAACARALRSLLGVAGDVADDGIELGEGDLERMGCDHAGLVCTAVKVPDRQRPRGRKTGHSTVIVVQGTGNSTSRVPADFS